MYPQVNKENELPSALPSYSDSINDPKYEIYNLGDMETIEPPQPTQAIVAQGNPEILPTLMCPHPRSVQLTCPTCKLLVMTRIEEEPPSCAYVTPVLIFCFMYLSILGMFFI